MGGDSSSKGRGFESQHSVLSHLFAVKIVMFVWKDENNQKEAGDGPFKKQVSTKSFLFLNLDELLISFKNCFTTLTTGPNKSIDIFERDLILKYNNSHSTSLDKKRVLIIFLLKNDWDSKPVP